MAATPNARTLEGLFAMGYPVELLQQAKATDLTEPFREQLRKLGIDNTQIDRANALVAYRAPGGDSFQAISSMLRMIGRDPADFDRIAARSKELSPAQGMKDSAALTKAMDEVLGVDMSSALRTKVPGMPMEGATWNPYRDDAPPKGVNVKYGSMGVITSNPLKPGEVWDLPGQVMKGATGSPSQAEAKPKVEAPKEEGLPNNAVTPGAGAGGKTGAGTDNKLPPKQMPHSPKEIEDWVKSHFGADAWFLDVPEVKEKLFALAATGSTDAEEAVRQVESTEWYHNTSATSRAWTAQKKRDPASILSDVAEQTAFLQSEATDMGLDIPPERMSAIAESSLRYGWSPVQLKSALGAEFHYDPKAKNQVGKVAAVKQLASKYLVPMSAESMKTWSEGLMTGAYTDQQFADYLKGTAKSLFPQLGAAIDAGHTVADYVDPYKEIAASTLELPPESIDFMDPKWRKALDQVDPKTGQRSVMTLSDWTSTLKTDKSYGYDKTKAGVGEAATLATSILKKFGKVG